jgi:single-stranded DNA-binding protein
MWVNAEMWDQEAKSNIGNLRKGSSFGGIGYMILNKWIDKISGEEKKANKIRILNPKKNLRHITKPSSYN